MLTVITLALSMYQTQATEITTREWTQLIQDLASKGQVTRYPDVHYVGYSFQRGDQPDPERDRHVEYLTLATETLENGAARLKNVNQVTETWEKLAPTSWAVNQTITTVEISGRMRSILKHKLVLEDQILKAETDVSLDTAPSANEEENWRESVRDWIERAADLPARAESRVPKPVAL